MLYTGGITLLSTVNICHVIIDSSHIYSIVINNITSFGLEDVEFLLSPPLLVFLHYHKTVQITWWHPCWPFLMTSLDDIIWWHHKCSWWTFSFSLLLLCWYSSTVIKHPSSQSNIVLPGLKNISHRSGPGGGNEEEFEKYKKEGSRKHFEIWGPGSFTKLLVGLLVSIINFQTSPFKNKATKSQAIINYKSDNFYRFLHFYPILLKEEQDDDVSAVLPTWSVRGGACVVACCSPGGGAFVWPGRSGGLPPALGSPGAPPPRPSPWRE